MELRRKNADVKKKEVSEPMDGCGAVWLDPEIPYVFFPKISGECHKKNGTLFVATIYLQFHTCFRFVKYTVPPRVFACYTSPELGEHLCWARYIQRLARTISKLHDDFSERLFVFLGFEEHWNNNCRYHLNSSTGCGTEITGRFWILMFLKVFCWNFRCR